MSKTSKIIVGIIIVVVVVVVGYLIYKGPSKPVSTEPIKIGFIGPLSGDAASFGETEKNATELAVGEINSKGGINGRLLNVIYEDGKCNGKDAANAGQKLVNIDQVKIILGGACSSETLAVVPITEKNKVLLFSAFSSNPAITNSGDYVFRNSPSDIDVAKLDAETISKLFKKVAMISENVDYSQGVRTVMKSIFENQKIDLVSDELYASSATDFRTILAKIKNTNPDVIYVNPGTSGKVGGIIVKQARELGFTGAIHGNFTVGSADAFSTGGSFLEGVVISDSSKLSAKGNNTMANYKSKFGKDPANDLEMAAAYDRVYIMRDAISKVGEDTDKIRDYMYGIKNFSGAMGDYHFDNNGDVVGVGFVNVVIKDGQKTPYIIK